MADELKYPHSSLWPTREQYLWLLREEASHRGLLFSSEEIDSLPSAFTCEDVCEPYDMDLTPDQWLDIDNYPKPNPTSGMLQNRTADYAKTMDSTERLALLKKYAWLYLEGIQTNVEKKLMEAGATVSQNPSPEAAVLEDLSTLWTSTVANPPTSDLAQALIGIFSDIPQETTTMAYITIPFNTPFTTFQSRAASLGLIRHLTKLHHPILAQSLFLDDELVYHHPYPTAIGMSGSDPSYPAEIYPISRDYNATDNGWYSHVVPAETDSMVNEQHDWRPINTESDWQSLLHVLRAGMTRKVFMRHKSVEDRMDFVHRHREREEREMRETGGCYGNMFLGRFLDELWDRGKLAGEGFFHDVLGLLE